MSLNLAEGSDDRHGHLSPIVRLVPLGADVQLRVSALEDPTDRRPALDVRLWRRTEGTWSISAAGFRVPLHLGGLVAEAIRSVSSKAALQLGATDEPRG